MIDSFWWYTSKRESWYDNIYRAKREYLPNMSCTDLMDITVLSILTSELYDALCIVLDNNEFCIWRLVTNEIVCDWSISSTEFDYSIRWFYISQRYDTCNEKAGWSESISDIWPKFASPEYEIHIVQKSTHIVSILFKMQIFRVISSIKYLKIREDPGSSAKSIFADKTVCNDRDRKKFPKWAYIRVSNQGNFF